MYYCNAAYASNILFFLPMNLGLNSQHGHFLSINNVNNIHASHLLQNECVAYVLPNGLLLPNLLHTPLHPFNY